MLFYHTLPSGGDFINVKLAKQFNRMYCMSVIFIIQSRLSGYEKITGSRRSKGGFSGYGRNDLSRQQTLSVHAAFSKLSEKTPYQMELLHQQHHPQQRRICKASCQIRSEKLRRGVLYLNRLSCRCTARCFTYSSLLRVVLLVQ